MVRLLCYGTRMTAKLTIAFSPEVLEALKANKSITIRLESGNGSGRRGHANGSGEPREGTLPARLIDWAQKKKGTFGTKDVEKKFKLSRAHASMLLSRLANGPFPISRQKRGVYAFRS